MALGEIDVHDFGLLASDGTAPPARYGARVETREVEPSVPSDVFDLWAMVLPHLKIRVDRARSSFVVSQSGLVSRDLGSDLDRLFYDPRDRSMSMQIA